MPKSTVFTCNDIFGYLVVKGTVFIVFFGQYLVKILVFMEILLYKKIYIFNFILGFEFEFALRVRGKRGGGGKTGNDMDVSHLLAFILRIKYI